jgi:hypothetical protein
MHAQTKGQAMKGQAGQWREEWAAVVRFAGALQTIRTGMHNGELGRGAACTRDGFRYSFWAIGNAMGWPDWMRFK